MRSLAEREDVGDLLGPWARGPRRPASRCRARAAAPWSWPGRHGGGSGRVAGLVGRGRGAERADPRARRRAATTSPMTPVGAEGAAPARRASRRDHEGEGRAARGPARRARPGRAPRRRGSARRRRRASAPPRPSDRPPRASGGRGAGRGARSRGSSASARNASRRAGRPVPRHERQRDVGERVAGEQPRDEREVRRQPSVAVGDRRGRRWTSRSARRAIPHPSSGTSANASSAGRWPASTAYRGLPPAATPSAPWSSVTASRPGVDGEGGAHATTQRAGGGGGSGTAGSAAASAGGGLASERPGERDRRDGQHEARQPGHRAAGPAPTSTTPSSSSIAQPATIAPSRMTRSRVARRRGTRARGDEHDDGGDRAERGAGQPGRAEDGPEHDAPRGRRRRTSRPGRAGGRGGS